MSFAFRYIILLLSFFSFATFAQKKGTITENSTGLLKVQSAALYIQKFNMFLENTNIDSAEYYALKILALSDHPTKSILNADEQKFIDSCVTRTIQSLGIANYRLGNIENAIKIFDKGLVWSKQQNYKKGTAIFFNELGHLMRFENKHLNALDYFEKALALSEEMGDSLSTAEYLCNVAVVFNNYGIPDCKASPEECLKAGVDAAVKYYTRSLDICIALEDSAGIAQIYNNLAYVEFNNGHNKRAESYYQKSLDMRYALADSISITYSLVNFGNFYYAENNLIKAKRYADLAYGIATRLGHPARIRDAANLSYKISLTQDNYKDALLFYKTYREMYDSILNSENQRLALDQELRYHYQTQKELDEIAFQKLVELEKKNQEIQRIILIAVISCLILVFAFLLILYRRLKITVQQKAIIETQKNIVEESKSVLQIKNQEILASINYAKRIQHALLPPQKKIHSIFGDTCFIYYRPKDVVAGDFYWLEQTENGILFAVADCTGHGVPGALVSIVCNNALNRSVREFGYFYPNEILDCTRKIVVEEFDRSEENVNDGMDISLLLFQSDMAYWAGANNPLWMIRKGELIELLPDKQPIGKFDYSTNFNSHKIQLEPGDTIYLFTDGYVDQFGGLMNKKFKKSRLISLLLSIQDVGMQEQLTLIQNTLDEWMGDYEQLDDICIAGFRI